MLQRMILTIALLTSTVVLADGGFVPKTVTLAAVGSSAAQKAVLIAEPDSEVLLLETTYRGPATDFAWIIPVPAAPREVFPANGEFIDAVFRETSPLLVDHFVREAVAPSQAGLGRGGESAEAALSQSQAAVRVLSRLEVGDYEALIFAATDTAPDQPAKMAQWLRDEGFAVTTGLTAILQEYASRQWVFVALKLQQTVVQQKPVLREVPPLGIRFPQSGGRLVFPLRVSRLSAPAYTAIALVTIARTSFRCKELPVVRLSEPSSINGQATYGELRRKMCRQPRPALFCEYCAARTEALAMSYRAGGTDKIETAVGGRATVSRYFGYLQPSEMEDLHFTPYRSATRSGYRVLVERTSVQQKRLWSSRDLQPAVDRFTADCGVLPRQPQDLVTQPTLGQDASGNPVAVEGWQGPYVVTGGPRLSRESVTLEGWGLDPLNIVFCDRLNATGEARAATLPECTAAAHDGR